MHRAGDQFVTVSPGISSRHAFSFGEHYDPGNVGFGRLLVSNTDVVATGGGYGDHPHRDAEILTWVLSGSLVHTDSAGNRGVVYPGLAQRMSAGRGIRHAERNDAYRVDATAPVVPVHFVQTWLRPDEAGTTPGYAQREVDLGSLAADWVPVASGGHPDAAVALGVRSATLWAARLTAGQHRLLPEAELVHLQVATGAVEVERAGTLAGGDTVRITGRAALRVTAVTDTEVLVWAMAGEGGPRARMGS